MQDSQIITVATNKDSIFHRYDIHFGVDLISKLHELIDLSVYTKIAVLTDSNLASIWLPKLKEALSSAPYEILIPAGENSKTVSTLSSVWEKLLHYGFDRKALLITLGGGVVGDLGGFAAATYMRGIDFIQIPTTLLSQVDASIGGKTGVNFKGVKNLVGTFTQPAAVIIDISLLSTQNNRDFCAGCAEIIKHGLICDSLYLKQIENWDFTNHQNPLTLEIIKRSCEIKAEVVVKDAQENGLRKILNFGHTAGHAFESLSLEHDATPLLHGEAVALGIMVEAQISHLQGYITSHEVEFIRSILIKFNLPTTASKDFKLEQLIKRTKSDKKNVGGATRWTLLKSVGNAVFDIEVSQKIEEEAFLRVISD